MFLLLTLLSQSWHNVSAVSCNSKHLSLLWVVLFAGLILTVLFFLFFPLIGAISPLSAAAAAAAAAGRVALSGSGVSGVLLASNLNEEVKSPQRKLNKFSLLTIQQY